MRRLLIISLLFATSCSAQVTFSNVSFSGVSTVSTVAAPQSALPTNFVGWQRIGDPGYLYSVLFGGTQGPNNCNASYTTACAYMNTTLLFSVPDSAANNASGAYTNSPNQGLPDGWNPSAPTVPLSAGTNGYGVFQGALRNLMNAQSEGILDPYRSVYYFFGGGHTDYYGNEIYAMDLTTYPFNVKRLKDAAWPANFPDARNNTAGTLINAMGGQTPASVYSECAANTTTGLGCSPGSRHTTQAMQVVTGRTWNATCSCWVVDHTKDFLFVDGGSGNPSGSTVKGLWTLPLGTPVTNSTQWIANYQMTGTTGYHTGPGVGESATTFGNTSAVDPRNGLVFVTDPNSSSLEALWAFDRFGSISAATASQSQGTQQQWYRLTSANGFFNTQDGSAALWHDAGTDKYWFIYAGGCRQEPITNVARSANVSTITYTQSISGTFLANGATFYLYNVSADSSFIGGPFTVTNTPGTTAASQTVTFSQVLGGVSSTASTGTIVTCTKGISAEHNGIRVADVTDTTTYGSSSVGGTVSSVTWTTKTMDPANVDLGDSTLGNTCAEFLTGGVNPLKFQSNGWGDQSPGFVVDGYTGNIIGWPNEGKYLYEIIPVVDSVTPTNSKLTCRRITPQTNASEDPPDTFTSSTYPTKSTWGAYGNGKFTYIPNADAFLLCAMPNMPCEIARIPRNIVTLFSTSGGTQTSRAVSIPRPFAQGEIANYPQPLVDGTLITGTNWQADVKNRWPDGSVKFAIVSLNVPSLTVAGNRVTFQNAASGNNTGYLLQAGMLGAGYDFDSVTTLTNSGASITRTVSARSMLSAGNWRYWLQGPVVTSVIIEDRSTARSWDTNTDGGGTPGSATNNPLHPMFEAYFYPNNNHVEVAAQFENSWASSTAANSANDQPLTSVSISQGSSSPTTCFAYGTSFTFIAYSRWQRHCKTGTAVGTIGMDLNAKYITATKALPNYDTSVALSTGSINTNALTPWAAIVGAGLDQNFTGTATTTGCGTAPCLGMFEKTINGTGQHSYVGLLPVWNVVDLLGMKNPTYRDSLRAVTIGNADIAGRMPIHFREADASAGTGQFFDKPTTGAGKPTISGTGSVGTFGRVISLNARQQESMANHNGSCGGVSANDFIAYNTHTADSISGIQTDSSHAPDMYYFPYLMTGSYYYLEGLQMEAAFYAMQQNPCWTSSSTVYNSAYRMGRWASPYASTSVRAQAWAFRTMAYAGFISPDADAEKAYFDTAVKQQIQIYEGGHLLNTLTSGTYGADTDLAAVWTYGKRYGGGGSYWGSGASTNLSVDTANQGPSPIGVWRSQGSGHVAGPQLKTDGSVDSGEAGWEESFMSNALGVAKDLGYSTDSLLKFTAKRYFRLALDSTYNAPYELQSYFEATHLSPGTSWISTGADYRSAFAVGYDQSCWQLVSGPTCNSTASVMQDSRPFNARSALSFMTSYTVDGFSGLDAWNVVDSSIPDKKWLFDVSGTNGSPTWSLVPR